MKGGEYIPFHRNIHFFLSLNLIQHPEDFKCVDYFMIKRYLTITSHIYIMNHQTYKAKK